MEHVLKWIPAFCKIVIKPNEAVIRNEGQKTKHVMAGLVFWSVLVSVMQKLFEVVVLGIPTNPASAISLMVLLPIILIFFVYILHYLYLKLFHRKKVYHEQMLFILPNIILGLTIVQYILDLIPGVGLYLGYLANLYMLILLIQAVKAITRLKLFQSITVVILSVIISGVSAIFIIGFFHGLVTTVPRVF